MMKPLQLMLITTILTAGASLARAGVIAEWNFDALAGGTTLEDQVGAIDGTQSGVGVSVVTSGAGIGGATGFDNAYDFIGNSNSVYVNMGTTATTSPISNLGTSAFTIAGWFDADERNSAGNYRYIFSNLGANGGFIVHLGTPGTASSRGKLLVQVGAGAGAVSVQSAGRFDLTADSQQWHWFAATSDGSTLKVFVDGTLIGSAAYNGSTTATPDAGSTSLIGRAFDGRIDQITVWNQQLDGTLDGNNTLTSGDLYDLWHESIPEPASLGLLSLGGLMLLRRGGSF